MKITIFKSNVKGIVSAPSSKSYTIRSLVCSALANGDSELIKPLVSDDTITASNVLNEVGVKIKHDNGTWIVRGGNLVKPENNLFCGESAATLRFMAAICSQIKGQSILIASPSLARRPIKPLLESLRQLGVKYSLNKNLTHLKIHGKILRGGIIELPGDISSQYISAILLLAPLTEKGVEIKLTSAAVSKPYILMTIKCMERFGININYSLDFTSFKVASQEYKPTKYTVEGDWSSASYLLALGAVAGEMKINNLNLHSLQADKDILNILVQMGIEVSLKNNAVNVKKSKLKPVKMDMTDCIDLLPTVAVLAALIDGTSEFTGIQTARLKESNRVLAVRNELGKMGIKVKEKKNTLVIEGGYPKSALIDSHGDHRIAMAFSILGTVCDELIIDGAECVTKTYPEFWDVLKKAGVELNNNG